MKLLKRCLLIISLLLNLSLTYVYISTYNELNGKINEYEVALKYLQNNNRRECNITEVKKKEILMYYMSIRELDLVEAQYLIDSYNFLYQYEISLDDNLIIQGELYTPIYWNS